MPVILKNEWKSGWKSLLIWALSVGGMGLIFIILYKGMEDSMADMAENYAKMGAFSDAFGFSTLSIATLKGYFAIEVGQIHALGSSMFAASIATVILSKEEDGHTAEYTFTLPVSRGKVIAMKFLAVLINLICFTFICGMLYEVGFVFLGETDFGSIFTEYMLFQLMMNIEIAAICFVISAVSKKNRLGIGISVALLLYVYDMMARVVPDLKDAIFISPFSYSNATSIFAGESRDCVALILGTIMIVIMTVGAGMIYAKRDLAS